MSLCYLILFLELCQPSVLSSVDLQKEMSSQFPLPRDLLKTELVGKKWNFKVGVENFFKRISPKAGIFENKQTNEIIFETKEKSWHQTEIIKNAQLFIHLSAMNDDIDLLEIFFERMNLNPNLKNKYGLTVLFYVAESNRIDVIELLLKHGAEIDVADNEWLITPLIHAVFHKNCDSVQVLLDHGADPNLRDIRDLTALKYAVEIHHVDVIESLLAHGANVDVADNELRTPLIDAVLYGNFDCVQVLLNYGANPNLRDILGLTALYYAAERNHMDIVEILSDHINKLI